MKLTGSLTERMLRNDLTNIVLSASSRAKLLVRFLLQRYVKVTSVYELHWVFEPDVEYFTFLVNGSCIVYLELDKQENVCTISKELSIEEYKIGLKKKDQLKLLVALDLASEY